MNSLNLVNALIVSPLFAVIAFSFTASLYLYYEYGSCVIKGLKTGKPKHCYYLGVFGIGIFALLFGSSLMKQIPNNKDELE